MRFSIHAQQATRLSGYQGSALRGVLGHALRRAHCLSVHDQPCKADDCVYRAFFEPKASGGEGQLASWADVPRPFVIEAPVEGCCELLGGEGFSFDVLVFGTASERSQVVIDAMVDGLSRGLGPDRVAFSAECEWTRAETVELSGHSVGADVSLDFPLPLRLQQEGHLTTDLQPEIVVRALLERISALVRVWQGESVTLPFRQIVDQASELQVKRSRTQLLRMSRLSGRQRKRIPLDGMVGNLVWGGGAVLDALWPLLRAGQLVHVGKGCVFGLGRMMAADAVEQLQELNR